MLKMAWDLLLASWLWVAAVIRLVMPSSSRSMACLQSVTTCCDKSDGEQKYRLRRLSNIYPTAWISGSGIITAESSLKHT